MKAASGDSGPPAVRGRPSWRYSFAGDEYGKVALGEGGEGEAELKVGDKIELVPSHCDTTINLHDVYYVVRDGRLEDIWPIAARGMIQ
jgi:3-hydroxy-D-aspartate aldolase